MTRTPRRHFPQVLHEILREAPPSIVAWNAQGTAFQIKHRQRFIEQILPQHPQMRISKYKSFVRQLNLWGFACLRTTDASGRKIGSSERGFYYHTHFRREEPHLCRHIHRVTRAGKVPPAGGGGDVPPVAAPTSAVANTNASTASNNTNAVSTTNRSRVSSISTSISSNASAASSSSSDFSGIYREEEEQEENSENERIMLHAMESFHRERSDSYSPMTMTDDSNVQSPSSDLRPLGPKPWFPTVPVGSAVTVAATTATVTPSLTPKVGVKMESSLPVAPSLQPQQRSDRLGRPVSPSGWSIGTFQEDDDDEDNIMEDKDATRVVSSDTVNLKDTSPETQHAVQQADQWTSAVLTPNNSSSKLTQAFDSQPCSSGFRHFEQSNVEQMALYQVWNRLERDEGTTSSSSSGSIPHSVVPGVSTHYANPFTK